jgi:coenzyme F420-0:L-glutamate ligase/homotetrameric cytidine deaminase
MILNAIGEFLEVLGIKTDLIKIGDNLVKALEKGMLEAGLVLEDGDILVVSESAVATSEGSVVNLNDISPSRRAYELAARYSKDPRDMQLILQESDQIMGGIPGVVLTMNKGFLYPNAGIDHSNAPPGYVVLFPADSQKSAWEIRKRIARGKRIGVIIGDSRTHPLRLGCVGVALGCAGVEPVEDARGQNDLYGRLLMITRKAVADNLVSAAQIVMGEGDEGVPAAIIRGAPVSIRDDNCQIPTIPPSECMYIGALKRGPRPYAGEYDNLIKAAILALEDAYAPYSKFRVGAAILGRNGQIYSAGNMENASSGLSLCAERAAISRALASGERQFEALAVVADTTKPVAPCGICRQNLIEFGEEIIVIMANLKGDAAVATVSELLPNAFTGKFLKKADEGCWL